MNIDAGILKKLRTAFKALFQKAFDEADEGYDIIAMKVPSTTKSNTYGWLGKLPGLRKWVGPRVVHSIEAHAYAILNEDFEATVDVDRNDILDDQLGTYNPLMSELGRSAKVHPTELVFETLNNAHELDCYDGQPFLDQDHPVLDKDGNRISVSNFHDVDNSNPRWYLVDNSRAVMPLIYQERQKPQFVAKTNAETSDDVFNNKKFVYGVDYRGNVGFALWQLLFASNAELNEANFDKLYDEMASQKGDHGRPLGITPKILLVPPKLRKKAQEVITVARKANGADNSNQDLVEVKVCPWLQ